MQTALIAGGSGFIGSHLSEKLLQDGYKVVVIDNFITGRKTNIETLLENPNFTLIELDLTDMTQKPQIPHADFVFHLASPASPNAKSPDSYINHPIKTMMVNSLGTQRLLDLAKEDNARFLFASTSEVYGDPAVSPQSEDYFGNVNPNGVRSVYDESKRYGEAITMAYYRKFNTDARIIRIFNTYGPKMQKDDGRVVSNFINQALNGENLTIYGNGSQTRSFCYVYDMVEGIAKAMFTQNTNGQVINLGNPDERTVSDLAALIKKMTNSSSEIVYEELPQDDPKKRNPDITKAQQLLSWSPRVTIEEGLEKTIQYFKGI